MLSIVLTLFIKVYMKTFYIVGAQFSQVYLTNSSFDKHQGFYDK